MTVVLWTALGVGKTVQDICYNKLHKIFQNEINVYRITTR